MQSGANNTALWRILKLSERFGFEL